MDQSATPTDMLKREHEIILLVLEAAEREAQSIEQRGRVNGPAVRAMLEFFQNFLDRCHHRKEEDHLFVKMQEGGMPFEMGPLAVMCREHEEGRRRLEEIEKLLPLAERGDSTAADRMRTGLAAYALLLRGHIQKENLVLYPMADSMLTEDDRQALVDAFARLEAEVMGEGEHERYHQLAHSLSAAGVR